MSYNHTVILYREVVYMNENNVQITSKGIRNSLRRYTPLKSICEYIWNGFDAKATEVHIDTTENDLETISSINLRDRPDQA